MPIVSICIFGAKQLHATSNQCSYSMNDVGCPVVGKSCSLSSSDPEESNILGVETAHTYGECAGRYRLLLVIGSASHFMNK